MGGGDVALALQSPQLPFAKASLAVSRTRPGTHNLGAVLDHRRLLRARTKGVLKGLVPSLTEAFMA